MAYTTLIESETLARHLRRDDWRVFDCRFVLTEPLAGERAYTAGHLPGARYLSLDRDLAGPVTPRSGRHPLPDPEALSRTLAAAGVGNDTQVVAYDDNGGAFAARLWWLLRWLGHRQAAVLDGGWRTWLAEKRPVTSEVPAAAAPAMFHGVPDDRLWLNASQVLAQTQSGQGRLFDARAAQRFRGEVEPIDAVAGHVPGAINLPFAGNLAEDGRFRSPEALRERFASALAGVPPGEAVCMCGSGVTACHNLLALEAAGLEGARLYPGSWSEWIRDPARPVARGSSIRGNLEMP